MSVQKRIRDLLEPLFMEYGKEIRPADKTAIDILKRRTAERNIPAEVTEQLVEFYMITNGVPCLDSFELHACDDEMIFEWWEYGELWIARRDMDVLRWAGGIFCLGDASNVSFGAEYEFGSLAELLEAAFVYRYHSGNDD
ncbi:MAG: hypothetical protein FWH45_00220 [Methanomassiliicoccaceae archaeon]|nr:hypothetical protein [Methanomassiliicoccaceae archaeon]MCL2145600.1 hypothetical protein [Methanomassiliicoccaceae archaeon]